MSNEAFTKDFENTAKVSKGVKLSNKKSNIQKKTELKKNNQESFKEDALKLIAEQKNNNAKMVTLSSTILKFIEDKTLIQNKSATAIEVERETRMKLVKLALEMDNDESIPELNMGSVSVLQVVLKCLFSLRDRLNDQEYNIFLLENKIDDLNSKLDNINNDGSDPRTRI